MERGDKGSTLIRMGVSGWMFLLVPAHPGCPGSKAIKRSLLLLLLWWWRSGHSYAQYTSMNTAPTALMNGTDSQAVTDSQHGRIRHKLLKCWKNAANTNVSDSLITWMPCLKSSVNSTSGVMPNFCFSNAASVTLASRTDLNVAISSSSYEHNNSVTTRMLHYESVHNLYC